GFLQILVEMVEDGAISPRLELADVKRALEPDAPDVGEPFAVRTDPRRHGAALDRHDGPLPAAVEIATDDRVDRAVRVLVVFELLARRDVLAVIEVAAVG